MNSDLWLVQATANVREISVLWQGEASAFLSWGDGPLRQQIDHNQRLTRAYTSWGAYRLRAFDIAGTLLVETVVVIRPTKPPVDIELDPHDRMTVVVRAPHDIDETEIIPRYTVEFGRIAKDSFWGIPGVAVHRAFDQPGRLPVRVQDLQSRAYTQKALFLEQRSLDFTLTAEDRTATLTVDRADEGKQLVVAWGDATLTEPVTGTTATHTYPSTVDDTYVVQLAYADNSGSLAKPVSIPAAASAAIPGGSP